MLPDTLGHFVISNDLFFGGRFVPETLMTALLELENVYAKAKEDKKFQNELTYYLQAYAGRPTSLYFAERLTSMLGGAKIYLKREDLLHTGAQRLIIPWDRYF